ncbi:MAG: hypothetical protein ABSB59_21690 [Streptosporangiaceae bacterium]|jgi:hypothetical protein
MSGTPPSAPREDAPATGAGGELLRVSWLVTLHLVPGQPAAPALVTGLITWFMLTARSDLAPPER